MNDSDQENGRRFVAENAVVINTISSHVRINEEYAYLERVCGKRDVDYSLIRQMQIDKNGREYDILEIEKMVMMEMGKCEALALVPPMMDVLVI